MLLDTVYSETLMIKIFDALAKVAEQEETSLLRLVIAQDDQSGTGSSQSSINVKVNRAAFDLLPLSAKLAPQGIATFGENCWKIERNQPGPKTIMLTNDWIDRMIPPPDFLWRMYLAYELSNLDVALNVSRLYTDHFRKNVEKWLDKVISRSAEVLQNSGTEQIRKTSIYSSVPLSHWFPANMASRVALTLKHFIKWARTFGLLCGPITDWAPVNNLLVVALYWSLAAALPVNARSAFSTELTSNILQLSNIPDLSQSILTTQLSIQNLTNMTEYDTAHCSEFIKSKDFILSKWLQSILVQTDQENLKSRLQLIGGPGAGKQTVMFYFDKDHPKVPSVMIPGGSKRFKDRFDLYSPTHLIPITMSQENCAIFNDSFHKEQVLTDFIVT